jgi:ABC-type amino acid transport substrate-binding protein
LLADTYLSIEPYALALRRGDEDFRLAVDRALSQIYRSGEVVKLFAASFGATVQPSPILQGLYMTLALPQ